MLPCRAAQSGCGVPPPRPGQILTDERAVMVVVGPDDHHGGTLVAVDIDIRET
jgi:hypothetical protein